MNPESLGSTLSGTGFLFILVIGGLLLLTPRRYAIGLLFISGCYMTLGQVLMVGALHFSIFRIIIFVGWVRVLVKGEVANVRFSTIDKVFLIWALVSSVAFVIARGPATAIIPRLGWMYNTLGTYFLCRVLVHSLDDVVYSIKMLAIIIIPLALMFLIEYKTGKNIFFVFGSVPEITVIRDGKMRCQGPFAHPILAGTFAATAVPLFIGLWAQKKNCRRLASLAIMAATLIVFVSSSSGPILAYCMAVTGLACWPFRKHMRTIRWGIITLIVLLAICMKAPVWYLIARMSEILGMGTGWHRSALIDAAIKHFDEWWLVGTTYTAHWMPTYLPTDPDNADITNQFIAEGVNGGLISICLFVWLLINCFSVTGRAVLDRVQFSVPERYMIWGMGCSLLGHVASFFSVPYFDQIIIFWYWLLAAICALAYPTKLANSCVEHCPPVMPQRSALHV